MPRGNRELGLIENVIARAIILSMLVACILIGVLILTAGVIWGFGGVFWATLGVTGLVAALFIIVIFIALPIIAVIYITFRTGQAVTRVTR